ncbi:MAG: hypothetical protein K2P14_03780 [Anaeroplasmataceae bacterium]|nr:hypothetical protein [Anaeroplasmataceae bacterium]
MADKETGLNIPVSAYADKNSAKEAVNDLTKGILNSLKDGYIAIPAEVKTSFNKSSKELDKAQKDIIKQWEKMSKEGFSSSEKYLNDLINKYQKFKKLAGQEGKGNSKQTKWLTSTIGKALQPYLAQKRELEGIIASFEKTTKTTKKSKRRNDKYNPDFGSHSEKEIKSNIKDQQRRQTKGLKSITGPMDYKTRSGANPGRTNDYSFKMSESSPYQSLWALTEARTRKEMKQREKDSLVEYKDMEKAKNAPKGRSTTKAEDLNIKASKSITELKNMIVGIEQGVTGLGLESVKDQIGIILDLFTKNGKDLEETFHAIRNAMEFPYSDNPRRRLGSTDGTNKEPSQTVKDIEDTVYKALNELWEMTPKAIAMMKRFAVEGEKATKTIKKSTNNLAEGIKIKSSRNQNSRYEKSKGESRESDNYKKMQSVFEKQTSLAMNEYDAERVADATLENIERTDAEDGFNSEQNTVELIGEIKNIDSILIAILDNIGIIIDNLKRTIPPEIPEAIEKATDNTNLPDLYRYFENGKWMTAGVVDHGKETSGIKKFKDITDYAKLGQKMAVAEIERERAQIEKGIHPSQQKSNMIPRSQDLASAFDDGKVLSAIKKVFSRAMGSSEVERIMSMNEAEQEKLRAERITRFGMSDGSKNPITTGDKIRLNRVADLWNARKGSTKGTNPFEDLQLTKGIGIDSKAITEALQTAIQKNMFKAQTGGALQNLVGSMTFYAGMPSIEKSRAEADAANQILANIREAALTLLQAIQSKETDLRGLETSGKVQFDDKGMLVSGTSEAKATFAEMEDLKMSLRGVLAEAQMVDDVTESWGDNITKVLQNLGFVSPELRKNNIILQNINAGLDKNGKALKFQKRSAEVLNYSLQLMARHVGQIWKNWLMQLNPLTQIKKLFSDFLSYDTKWQRTMNVIKYNIRAIFRPFMQWIAQQLVNIIGFVDIISMKIQKALGKIPVSLFDQSAANAEKMKEELEAGANVTAGFDELHDIGSDNTGANDLFGDIYTPQLSPAMIKLAELLGDILTNIAKAIKWCIDNWKILAGLLAAFAIAKALWDLFNLFGGLGKILGNIPSLLSKIGWGGLATGAAWAAAIAGSLIDAYYTWKMISKWGGMSPEERQETGDKGIKAATTGWGIFGAIKGVKQGMDFAKSGAMSGVSLLDGLAVGALYAEVTSGLAKAVSAGIKTGFAFFKGDTETMNHFAVEVGEGVGQAGGAIGGAIMGAKIGAILGGPVGASIGVALGSIVGGFAGSKAGEWLGEKLANSLNKVSDWFFGTGTFQKLHVSLQDVKEAEEAAIKATNDYYSSLDSLTQMEQLYGISGKEVNDMIENGTLKLTELTPEQYKVYKAYQDMTAAQDEMKASLERELEYEAKWAEFQAEKSGNYTDYIETLKKGVQQGIISQDSMLDHFSQTYASLDKEHRKIFIQQLPENMRESVIKGADSYYSEWGKFKEKMKTLWNGLADWFTDKWQRLADWWNSLWNKSEPNGSGGGFSRGGRQWTDGGGSAGGRSYIPAYAVGTNYVPSDGLAYLHQGEAVIPKKYNQPYNAGMSAEERTYMERMMNTMNSLDSTIKQGINVTGEFRQRGSDLVAVTEKAKNKNGHQPLNNPVFAR